MWANQSKYQKLRNAKNSIPSQQKMNRNKWIETMDLIVVWNWFICSWLIQYNIKLCIITYIITKLLKLIAFQMIY